MATTTNEQEQAAARAWLRKRWDQDHPNEGHVRMLAEYADHLATRPTPSGLDPATVEACLRVPVEIPTDKGDEFKSGFGHGVCAFAVAIRALSSEKEASHD